MPRNVKGTTDEREQFMFTVFRDFYADPANAGKDLSVAKANDIFRKKYGSMLRNKKAYQLRASAKAQASARSGGPGEETPTPTGPDPMQDGRAVAAGRKAKNVVAGRNPQLETTSPGAPGAAALITGTPDQIAFLKGALEQLQAAGLATGRVDHATDAYVVVARA